MRSTNQIIISVKENKPVEPEELRMALLVLNSVDYFIQNELDQLIEVVLEGKSPGSIKAELRASFAKETLKRMFQAMKADPVEWLGPANIPGNPEYEERYRTALALGKKLGVI